MRCCAVCATFIFHHTRHYLDEFAMHARTLILAALCGGAAGLLTPRPAARTDALARRAASPGSLTRRALLPAGLAAAAWPAWASAAPAAMVGRSRQIRRANPEPDTILRSEVPDPILHAHGSTPFPTDTATVRLSRMLVHQTSAQVSGKIVTGWPSRRPPVIPRPHRWRRTGLPSFPLGHEQSCKPLRL